MIVGAGHQKTMRKDLEGIDQSHGLEAAWTKGYELAARASHDRIVELEKKVYCKPTPWKSTMGPMPAIAFRTEEYYSPCPQCGHGVHFRVEAMGNPDHPARISQRIKDLGSDIAGIKDRLDDDIDPLLEKIRERIDALEARPRDPFAEGSDTVATFDEVIDKHGEQITEIEKILSLHDGRIHENYHAANTRIEKMHDRIAALEARP